MTVRPLSETHMDAAVYQWKHEFPMNAHTRDRIDALEDEDTRRGNKAARDLRNGAFGAYLQQTSIHKQLALACVKHPYAGMPIVKDINSCHRELEKACAKRLKASEELLAAVCVPVVACLHTLPATGRTWVVYRVRTNSCSCCATRLVT